MGIGTRFIGAEAYKARLAELKGEMIPPHNRLIETACGACFGAPEGWLPTSPYTGPDQCYSVACPSNLDEGWNFLYRGRRWRVIANMSAMVHPRHFEGSHTTLVMDAIDMCAPSPDFTPPVFGPAQEVVCRLSAVEERLLQRLAELNVEHARDVFSGRYEWPIYRSEWPQEVFWRLVERGLRCGEPILQPELLKLLPEEDASYQRVYRLGRYDKGTIDEYKEHKVLRMAAETAHLWYGMDPKEITGQNLIRLAFHASLQGLYKGIVRGEIGAFKGGVERRMVKPVLPEVLREFRAVYQYLYLPRYTGVILG